MDPNMIEIGNFRIAWYGFFLTLSIFAALEWAKRYLKRWGYDPDQFERTAFWAVIWGVVGARLGYVLTSPSQYLKDPVEIFYIWHGGLSFHGGIIGGLLVFIYYSRRYRAPLMPYLDAVTPGVALGIIAGRLGNFMNGSDTVGRLTTLPFPFGFTWPKSASGFPGVCPGINDISEVYKCAPEALVRGPVHLTQWYGVAIGLILVFLTLRWLAQKRAFGYAFWQFVLWYSLLRSVLEETFRLNPLVWRVYQNDQIGIGLFTLTQLVSIPLVLLALFMLRKLPPGERAATVPVLSPAGQANAKAKKKL